MNKQNPSGIVQVFYTKLTLAVQQVSAHATKPFPQISLTSSLLASLLSRPIFLVHTTPKQLVQNIIELFFPTEKR